MVEEAEKKTNECAQHQMIARDEALVTEGWCNDAKKQRSKKGLEKCIKGAEKTVKKAMDEAKKATESLHKVRDVKHKLMRENVKHEAEQKKERVKKLVTTMKDDIDDRLDDMKKDLKWLEKKISREKNEDQKAKYERQKETLEADMKRLEEDSKESANFLEEEAKIDEKIELLRVDLTNADDENDWLEIFSKLVEEEAPKQLMYFYNSTTPGGPGCLDENPEVKVECWPVEREYETKPLDECELDFDWN